MLEMWQAVNRPRSQSRQEEDVVQAVSHGQRRDAAHPTFQQHMKGTQCDIGHTNPAPVRQRAADHQPANDDKHHRRDHRATGHSPS